MKEICMLQRLCIPLAFVAADPRTRAEGRLLAVGSRRRCRTVQSDSGDAKEVSRIDRQHSCLLSRSLVK